MKIKVHLSVQKVNKALKNDNLFINGFKCLAVNEVMLPDIFSLVTVDQVTTIPKSLDESEG